MKHESPQAGGIPAPVVPPKGSGAKSSGALNYSARCREFASIDDYLAEVEREILLDTLESVRWNKTLAAKELGITFRSLRYRLQKLGLETD